MIWTLNTIQYNALAEKKIQHKNDIEQTSGAKIEDKEKLCCHSFWFSIHLYFLIFFFVQFGNGIMKNWVAFSYFSTLTFYFSSFRIESTRHLINQVHISSFLQSTNENRKFCKMLIWFLEQTKTIHSVWLSHIIHGLVISVECNDLSKLYS